MTNDELTIVVQRKVQIPVSEPTQCAVCNDLLETRSSVYLTSPEMLRDYVSSHEHYKDGYTGILSLPAHKEPGINNTKIRVVPDLDREFFIREDGFYRIAVYEGSIHKASLDFPPMLSGDSLSTLTVSLNA